METLGTIVAWALFGLIVGALARAVYPGEQPMSWTMTMILGVVGSLVGGFVSWMFGYDPQLGPFRGAGWIMSIVGALVLVWAGLFANSRSKGAGPVK